MRELFTNPSNRKRSLDAALLTMIVFSYACAPGCLSPWIKDKEEESEVAQIEELLTGPDKPELVGDATVDMGMNPVKLESLAIVNGLEGTGGIPEPSRQRDSILSELKTRDIADPNAFLDSKQTAMVTVESLLPPGIRENEPIDLFVRISQRSSANSLRNGWLMPTRLRELRRFQNQVRTSDVLAAAKGTLLLRRAYESGNEDAYIREAVIPGGGRASETRPLGLIIRPAFQHAFVSAQIANDINRRFFFFDGTSRRGIANAKEDDFIEISTHPTYRRNIYRMMAVVKSVAVDETLEHKHARIAELKLQLTEPTTAALAAMQLEAIGEEGIDPLIAASTVANSEIRFYAAEALAYLDRVDAIEPLKEIARTEPAFRLRALLGLSVLEHRLAAEALRELLDDESNETRYGAFRSLRERPDRDLMVPGTSYRDEFAFFNVPSKGTPFVAVSTTQQAEVVLFGGPIPIRPPKYLMGGSGIMVLGNAQGGLKLSRFQAGKQDQRANVPATVTGLITGITKVGGNYSDVVEILRIAKEQGDLMARFAIDPLPKTQRVYSRESDSDIEPVGPEKIDPPEVEETKSAWWSLGG